MTAQGIAALPCRRNTLPCPGDVRPDHVTYSWNVTGRERAPWEQKIKDCQLVLPCCHFLLPWDSKVQGGEALPSAWVLEGWGCGLELLLTQGHLTKARNKPLLPQAAEIFKSCYCSTSEPKQKDPLLLWSDGSFPHTPWWSLRHGNKDWVMPLTVTPISVLYTPLVGHWYCVCPVMAKANTSQPDHRLSVPQPHSEHLKCENRGLKKSKHRHLHREGFWGRESLVRVSPNNSQGQTAVWKHMKVFLGPIISVSAFLQPAFPILSFLSSVVMYCADLVHRVHLKGDCGIVLIMYPHVWDTAETSRAAPAMAWSNSA